MYNPSNNELLRTKTLVKNAIVSIDGNPFRLWFESHYSVPIGRRKSAANQNKTAAEKKAELAAKFAKKASKAVKRKFALRKSWLSFNPPWKISSSKVVCWLASRLALVNLDAVTATYWKGKNWSFTERKLERRRTSRNN